MLKEYEKARKCLEERLDDITAEIVQLLNKIIDAQIQQRLDNIKVEANETDINSVTETAKTIKGNMPDIQQTVDSNASPGVITLAVPDKGNSLDTNNLTWEFKQKHSHSNQVKVLLPKIISGQKYNVSLQPDSSTRILDVKQFYLKRTDVATDAYHMDISVIKNVFLQIGQQFPAALNPDEVSGNLSSTKRLIKFTYIELATQQRSIQSIWVAGEFNGWLNAKNSTITPNNLPDTSWKMQFNASDKTWSCDVALEPGDYQCKIVIDVQDQHQEWVPAAANKTISVSAPTAPVPQQIAQKISFS